MAKTWLMFGMNMGLELERLSELKPKKALSSLSLQEPNICFYTSPEGEKLRPRRTLERFNEAAQKAGITSKAYIHKFRHTYATLLVRQNTPPESIKELLGHWCVIEAERYAHNESDYLHDEVVKLDHLLGSEPTELIQ
jgi:site-specific recombinase XerD